MRNEVVTGSKPTQALIIHSIKFDCPFNGLWYDIHLCSQESYECNCLILKDNSNIWNSSALQEFVAILWSFVKNPKSNFTAQKNSFYPPSTGSIRRKWRTYWVSTYKPRKYQVCRIKRVLQNHSLSIFAMCAPFYTFHKMWM